MLWETIAHYSPCSALPKALTHLTLNGWLSQSENAGEHGDLWRPGYTIASWYVPDERAP